MAAFLKWAGGKRRLLPVLLPLMPEHMPVYVEPFLGGGSVFFALAAAGRIGEALLSDANADLINAYRVVRDAPDMLMEVLDAYAAQHKREGRGFYLMMRKAAGGTGTVAAARFIFLNKAGFNGLHRVNARGEFNTPWGQNPSVALYQRAGLEEASRLLQGVAIRHMDFREALGRVADRAEAFIYLDPPYLPLNATSFTSYAGTFGMAEHQELAERLRAVQGQWMLSNSPPAHALFQTWECRQIMAPRSISRDGQGRQAQVELLVRSLPSAAPFVDSPDQMGYAMPTKESFMHVVQARGTVRNDHEETLLFGPRTILWGPSGAGKSRWVNTLTLALTKTADEMFGRKDPTRDTKDLAFLTSAPEFLAEVTFDVGIRAVMRATIDGEGKLKGLEHNSPFPVGDVLPMRDVWEALCAGPDKAAAFFLPKVVRITWEELSRKVQDLGITELSLLGAALLEDAVLSDDGQVVRPAVWRAPTGNLADALVEAIEAAASAALTASAAAAAANALVERTAQQQDPEPLDSVVSAARAAVSQWETYHAGLSEWTRYQDAVQRLREIEAEAQQLTNYVAHLDAWKAGWPAAPQGQHPVVPHILAVQEGMMSAGAAQCWVCGNAAHPTVITNGANTLRSALAGHSTWADQRNALETQYALQRKQTDDRLGALKWERAEKERSATQAPTVAIPQEIVVQGVDGIRGHLQAARAHLQKLEQTQAAYRLLRAQRKIVTEKEAEATRLHTIKTRLRQLADDLIKQHRMAFLAEVQTYLPKGYTPLLVMEAGKRRIFRWGLQERGRTFWDPSEGQRQVLCYAITAAIVARDPERRYALIAPCFGSAISADLLGDAARALTNAPAWAQVVLIGHEAPKGHGLGSWIIHALGPEKEKRPRKAKEEKAPEEKAPDPPEKAPAPEPPRVVTVPHADDATTPLVPPHDYDGGTVPLVPETDPHKHLGPPDPAEDTLDNDALLDFIRSGDDGGDDDYEMAPDALDDGLDPDLLDDQPWRDR